ncbi:hypothetical protein D3C75_573800 [compost metagenome]
MRHIALHQLALGVINICHAMHLHLGFNFQQRHHFRHFVHVQLTGQNDPRSTLAPPVIGGGVVGRSHFRIPMQLQMRRFLLCGGKHGRIAEFDAVYTQLPNSFDICGKLVQQAVRHQAAQACVDLAALLMSQLDDIRCILQREVARQPHAKTVIANQQRIGSGLQQHSRFFQGSGCRQQLRFVIHVASSYFAVLTASHSILIGYCEFCSLFLILAKCSL